MDAETTSDVIVRDGETKWKCARSWVGLKKLPSTPLMPSSACWTQKKRAKRITLLNNSYVCGWTIHMHHAESISIMEKCYVHERYSTPKAKDCRDTSEKKICISGSYAHSWQFPSPPNRIPRLILLSPQRSHHDTDFEAWTRGTCGPVKATSKTV